MEKFSGWNDESTGINPFVTHSKPVNRGWLACAGQSVLACILCLCVSWQRGRNAGLSRPCHPSPQASSAMLVHIGWNLDDNVSTLSRGWCFARKR